MEIPPSPPDAALRALLDRYGALIKRVVDRVGGPAVRESKEDVAQIVAMNLWQQVSREQTITHPPSYIYRAAIRETVREVRRRLDEIRSHTAIGDAVEPLSAAPDPEQAASAQQIGVGIEEAIRRLSPERAIAVRAHLAGYTVEEIMQAQGWTYQKARNLIARGMADLREDLKKGGYGD